MQAPVLVLTAERLEERQHTAELFLGWWLVGKMVGEIRWGGNPYVLCVLESFMNVRTLVRDTSVMPGMVWLMPTRR